MSQKLIKIIKKWEFNNENFVCPKCRNIFPKKTATRSGEKGFEFGIHVHCKKCGCIVSGDF